MEWFKLIIELIQIIIWPLTVLIILRYRHEIFGLIAKNLKTFKYGSAEFDLTKDLSVIEETIEKSTELKKITVPQLIHHFTPKDPHLIIAQIRINFENELFKLYRVALSEYREFKTYNLGNYLREMRIVKILGEDIVTIAKEFIQLSNKIVHGVELSNEVIERVTAIGITLNTEIHFKRKVYELVDDFKGNGLWHMHFHLEKENQKYYFYSAVTASLPEFDYSYEIYHEAAKKYTEEDEKYHGKDSKTRIKILNLSEFIIALEHRERELFRLLNSHSQIWSDFEKANEWQWPKEWGNLGWTGPIIRDRLSTNRVRDELMQTQTALNHYRSKLILSNNLEKV